MPLAYHNELMRKPSKPPGDKGHTPLFLRRMVATRLEMADMMEEGQNQHLKEVYVLLQDAINHARRYVEYHAKSKY